MITIQDVLDLLRTGLPPSGLTESEWLQHKVYEACGMLQEIADKQPRWISVKDRLPEEYLRVLVYDKIDHKIGAAYVSSTTGPIWVDDDGYYWSGKYFDGFTHWMPLPEPPEAE